MKALVITDLHGSQPAAEFVKRNHTKYDLTLCAGDLTNFGSPSDYVDYLSEIITGDFLWVSGNNDVGQSYQYRSGNLNNIDGTVVDILGHKIAGLGGSAPNYEGQNFGPTLDSGSDLSGSILLSHVPPSCRLFYQKEDINCLNAIDKIKDPPRAHICGHLHSKGIACIGRTKVIKVGAAKDGDYAELDLESLEVRFKNFLVLDKK